MNQSIRIARNQTAVMQWLQRLVSSGHFYWTTDQIIVSMLPRLIAKWQPSLQLRADAAARAYRKRTGRASVHLAIHPDCLDASTAVTTWWMLSTAGKEGLAPVDQFSPRPSKQTARQPSVRRSFQASDRALSNPATQMPGKVHDCRTLQGRLRLGDYELLMQPKTFVDKSGKVKTLTTWTWRMTPSRYREWEALLVERALARDRAEIARILECLKEMPMFAGIRCQVMRLMREANKVLAKTKAAPLQTPELPAMRMVRLWQDGGEL